VGSYHQIEIPDLSRFRYSPGRLKGLRCIHTHLKREGISEEDLTDLSMLRLDAMVAIQVSEKGLPQQVEMAYLLPPNPKNKRYEIAKWPHPAEINMDFQEFIIDLENQMEKAFSAKVASNYEERAILISVTRERKSEAEYSMAELVRLAESANIKVLDTIIQRVKSYNPELLMGKGKLQEVIIKALSLGATMIIFDQELSPKQINNIAKLTDLKVIDRNQLILDIFAKRAQSREGKIQVELAQLKYMYPRIIGKGEAMSRLTGGIGGRGPGETKLEVDRRRIKKRIATLEKQLEQLKKQRRERRKTRKKSQIPVISLVGYTNAGKSTLLNALCSADVYTEDRLFATLDPTNRTLYLPEVGKCILTDTVGFIKRMPHELKVAFRATLEELEDASLLIHVVDATSPYMEEEIEAVNEILEELELDRKERLIIYNKCDLLEPWEAKLMSSSGKLLISAKEKLNLDRLKDAIKEALLSPALQERDRFPQTF